MEAEIRLDRDGFKRWRVGVCGIVERAMKVLVEGMGEGLELNVYHGRCARDTTDGEGRVVMCYHASLVTIAFLNRLRVRKVFHASPLEAWVGGNDLHDSVIMMEEMRRKGWGIRLYEDDCLDPAAEPTDFS